MKKYSCILIITALFLLVALAPISEAKTHYHKRSSKKGKRHNRARDLAGFYSRENARTAAYLIEELRKELQKQYGLAATEPQVPATLLAATGTGEPKEEVVIPSRPLSSHPRVVQSSVKQSFRKVAPKGRANNRPNRGRKSIKK